MTRFWLTLDQAVQLVLDAFMHMNGGEIFVPLIPSMSITEVAKTICPDCELKEIGIRPGEKIHEILVSEDNANTWHIQHGTVLKALPGYTSDTNVQWMSREELRRILCINE